MKRSEKRIFLHAGFRLSDIKAAYARENDRIAKLPEEKGIAKTKNRKNG